MANNQHIQKKLKLYFVNGHSANLSKCAKIWPSKSIFCQKLLNLTYHFRSTFFYYFWQFWFLKHFICKSLPNFWQGLFTKYNNFLEVCWFVANNLILYPSLGNLTTHIAILVFLGWVSLSLAASYNVWYCLM